MLLKVVLSDTFFQECSLRDSYMLKAKFLNIKAIYLAGVQFIGIMEDDFLSPMIKQFSAKNQNVFNLSGE